MEPLFLFVFPTNTFN